jgi:hypothetical protein
VVHLLLALSAQDLYQNMKQLIGVAVLSCLVNVATAQVAFPGHAPGKAQAAGLTLQNNALAVTFAVKGQQLLVTDVENKLTHTRLALNTPVLTLTGKNNASLKVTVKQAPVEKEQGGMMHGGKVLNAVLAAPGLDIQWEASLDDDANYVRQKAVLSAADSTTVSNVTMIQLPAGVVATKGGTVDGSPLLYKNMFMALEHPMAQVKPGSISLPRLEPVRHDHPVTLAAVWGVTPAQQVRRGFLYYVERERALPYRQMLHYNSWFDISWSDRKMDEAGCLDRIHAFGDSLVIARKVAMNAFLFDDGWDDNKTLWQFNSGFPNGFTPLKGAAAAYHAGIGVWISPWGGYDKAKEQRMAFGKQQNPPFEMNANGFSVSGPIYRQRFRSVTDNFITNFNVSVFKFDGVGAGNGASGASVTYQKDIESFLSLITDMRQLKPDLYFSLTVGTWPSVYWLNYGDCIWRAGDDTGLEGKGPKRQQWITYRDAQAYKNIVKRAPLYPLNSIMYHGVCIADNGLPGTLEMDDKNVSDEIWSFFGTGTSLQEMYINPHKLNTYDWNVLRDAANWSKAHAAILSDVHWVGGDPALQAVYGFAAWGAGQGALTLRNPSPVAKTFTVNVRRVFEIPAEQGDNYLFTDARSGSDATVYSGSSFTVQLQPFETKVLSAQVKN